MTMNEVPILIRIGSFLSSIFIKKEKTIVLQLLFLSFFANHLEKNTRGILFYCLFYINSFPFWPKYELRFTLACLTHCWVQRSFQRNTLIVVRYLASNCNWCHSLRWKNPVCQRIVKLKLVLYRDKFPPTQSNIVLCVFLTYERHIFLIWLTFLPR